MKNNFVEIGNNKEINMRGGKFMTPLYDYNVAMIMGNYLVKAIANDKDLKINSKKSSSIKKLLKKLSALMKVRY